MVSSLEKILEKVQSLSHRERAVVARQALQSLDIQQDPERDEAWKKEIETRIADIKSGKDEGRLASEIFEEFDKRFRK